METPEEKIIDYIQRYREDHGEEALFSHVAELVERIKTTKKEQAEDDQENS